MPWTIVDFLVWVRGFVCVIGMNDGQFYLVRAYLSALCASSLWIRKMLCRSFYAAYINVHLFIPSFPEGCTYRNTAENRIWRHDHLPTTRGIDRRGVDTEEAVEDVTPRVRLLQPSSTRPSPRQGQQCQGQSRQRQHGLPAMSSGLWTRSRLMIWHALHGGEYLWYNEMRYSTMQYNS